MNEEEILIQSDFEDEEFEDDYDNEWDEYDRCYECKGYGDDYFINDDGELECFCYQCSMNPDKYDE